MHRKSFLPFSGALTAAVLGATACGGTVDGVDLGQSAGAYSTFAGTKSRAYFGVTNEIASEGRPAAATFDLVAGARVELEIATRDSSPLEFELRRVRRDGTSELVEHVRATSGFHLETFVASSDDSYALYFAEAQHAYQTFVVHFVCKGSGSGVCSPNAQPGDACSAVDACDTGLVCAHQSAELLARGVCAFPAPAARPQ